MPRTVVRQFLLAVAVIAVYVLLWNMQSYYSMPHMPAKYGPPWLAVLKGIPRALLFTLPFVGGIALALLPIRAGAFRYAAILVGLVTGLMILDDTALRSVWRAYDAATTTPDSTERARPLRFADTTGAISASWAHLRGRVRPEDIQKWPPDTNRYGGAFNPITSGERIVRMSATMSYNQLTNLLMPFLGAGLVLGIGAWLSQAVVFKRPRDERLLRLLSAWVVVPASVMFVMSNQRGMWYNLSSDGGWLGWLFLPVLAGLIPAFLGWRAVWRLDRLGAE